MDADSLPFPPSACDGQQDFSYLAAVHGLKVATMLLHCEWSDNGAKQRWKLRQIGLMKSVADDYVATGRTTRHQADGALRAFRKAMLAQLGAPNSIIEIKVK